MAIKSVFFDVGETLVDETRHRFSWADWLGVPRLTFAAALGAVIERGEHHRHVFELVWPGFDFEMEVAARLAAGQGYVIEPADLYPDVLDTLRDLKAAGYTVGIAGNQPEETEAALRKYGVMADHFGSSTSWGVEKPSCAFFARIVEAANCSSGEIACVGDRLDNDVLAAKDAGLFAVFLLRGPWALIHARRSEASAASATITGLRDLAACLPAPSDRPSHGRDRRVLRSANKPKKRTPTNDKPPGGAVGSA